jgi:hypothetical protein
MPTRSVLHMSLAIALCALLLIAAMALPGESGAELVPNPDHGKSEAEVTLPNLLVHYYRPPSATEVALSAILAAVSLIGVSVFVARLVANRRILAGVGAAIMSTTLALLILAAALQRFPKPHTIYIGTIGSILLGAAGAWMGGRWWPNKSLERTRGR